MISSPIFQLDSNQHYVLDCLDKGEGNFFLTGKAGTGKSTLLNAFRRLSDRKAIFLAPTGIAAIQIKGQTIHSFFRFPATWIQPSDYKKIPSKWLKEIDWIVIDEVSMVRADLLDHLNEVLKISLKSNLPFGGKPMFWMGDLYQLPPVVQSQEEKQRLSTLYASPYFFSSKAFQSLRQFEMIELQKIYRQRDTNFIRLLNKMRDNQLDEEDLEEINSRFNAEKNLISSDQLRIQLCTTNRMAQIYNHRRLESLASASKVYPAVISGKVNPGQFPTDELLTLKAGAQVMFLRNDPQKRYVNGMLGIIERMENETILIQVPSSNTLIELEAATWEVIRYNTSSNDGGDLKPEITGTFRQFPIKLAWAVTIHKSQGQSFDYVDIDFGSGAFEYGQAYVAFSRCTSLEGIRLNRPLRQSDILNDERIVDFMNLHR